MGDQQIERGFPLSQTLTTGRPRTLGHIPRLLAFDGGGVRGLSSLLIVQKLMQEVQRLMEEEGRSTSDGKPPLPCEYFDLICGTSTGGVNRHYARAS